MNPSAPATGPATAPAPPVTTAPPPPKVSNCGTGFHLDRTSKIAGATALGLLVGLAVIKVLQAD